MTTTFTRVTILGAGVLGSQIAFQAADHGKEVTLYDVSDEAVQAATARLEAIVSLFVHEVPSADRDAAAAAARSIAFSTDLEESVREADLVIEAVPERVDLKREVYARIGAAAAPRTVFATNSSTLLPSALAESTGRPDRFLALHFANHVWVNNTAEIMGSPETSPEVYADVAEFAREIGMVPIELHREQSGYVLNSLLIPLLNAAAGLLLKGVATPETIDTTWRIGTGAPKGPFEIFDIVGLRTAYAISSEAGGDSAIFADHLKTEYLDKGKFGVESGEGFYRYPAA
jgi:3-hydroxyacyl-CoA dehydrogenase